MITERCGRQRKGILSKLVPSDSRGGISLSSVDSRRPASVAPPFRRNYPRGNNVRPPRLRSDTLRGVNSFFGTPNHKQYTITPKKKYRNKLLNWCDSHHMNFADYFCHSNEVDVNVYKPSHFLYRYISWTFAASFTSVFLSFLFIFSVFNLIFGCLLMLAGDAEPYCIMMAGEPFGTTPHTKFSDAFALSWTTFATVGYGMTYTSVGSNFGNTKPSQCTWVVLLCTSEAFLGLLFAGMCAAILFGKINRIQSHANIIFSNAVCLQYEEIADEDEDDYSQRGDHRNLPPVDNVNNTVPGPVPRAEDEENQLMNIAVSPSQQDIKFVDQFNGCPVLKFQVVNEFSNREGSEIVDCIMKVIGIKFKGHSGRVTQSQYVRVNLVDFEHPFLSRVWHGVHILDATSPLLTDKARQRIKENNGSWPSNWLDPDVIRSKLEFHDLIVTVAGLSNVSAVTVHAYKRYKIGDVLIGFNFAPLVFGDSKTGLLEVDLARANDVREQSGLRGENLSQRHLFHVSKENTENIMANSNISASSNIRIKRSRMGSGLGTMVPLHHRAGSIGRAASLFAHTTENRSSKSVPEAFEHDSFHK
ncbi:hypothetical protein ACHAW5_000895 [Stephanodiscus triporus]|uniref:Inward rectifier potassium channel C-terminal domain-containing protein n=1 Tax=Stephanodiscus triporus TaxID=2934178 RepID=A0ABD3NLH4_9STRA